LRSLQWFRVIVGHCDELSWTGNGYYDKNLKDHKLDLIEVVEMDEQEQIDGLKLQVKGLKLEIETLKQKVETWSPNPTVKSEWFNIYDGFVPTNWNKSRNAADRTACCRTKRLGVLRKDIITQPDGITVSYKLEIESD